MAMSSAWLLLVAAGCAVAVDAVGGPPPVDDRIRTDIFARGLGPRFSLPSKEDPHLPLETLKAIDKLWDLPFFQDDEENLKSVQNIVTVTTDDIDKADNVMHPPLEYSVPETFRQPDDAFFDSVADTEAWDSSTEAAETAEAADESKQGSDTRRLADWLPEGVQKYLPKVPTLSSILPSYIPGVNLQAEVHRKPIRLPVIPSAADVKVYVSTLVQRAFDNLHRKQLQLAELIKCSCPRPARCDAILEEFLDGIKPNKKPSSPSAANIATPAGAGAGAASGAATGANAGSASPQLSIYAGLTKPDGEEGPGLGFYVDQSGPHFSHHSPQHQHQQHQSQATAQAQASATSAAQSQASKPSSSSASAQSSSSAQSSTHAAKPSGPSGSASSHSSASASSHSSASASSHSSASASSHSSASASSHSSASASSHSSASGSGPNASAAALSSASASAHRQQLQGGVSVPPAVPPVPTPTEYTATYGAPTPALPLPTFAAPPTVGRDPAPPRPHRTSVYAPETSDNYPYPVIPDEASSTIIPERAEPSEPLYPSQPDPETATSPMTRE